MPGTSSRVVRRCLPALALIFGWSLVVAPASAQSLRNELGKRLQRFETAWQGAEPLVRAKSLTPMQGAVSSFFSLRLANAARQLDEAWYAVRVGGEPTAVERWGVARQAAVTPLFGDVAERSLTVSLRPLYETPEVETESLRARLALSDGAGRVVLERSVAWSDLKQPYEWSIGDVGAGDYTVLIELLDGERRWPIARTLISRAERLRERLAALAKGDEQIASTATPTVRATLAAQRELLEALAASKPQETDYPAARMLTDCETLLAAPRGQTIAERASRESVWMTLCAGTGQTPVRVRAPGDPAKRSGPLPVLFLFHGAGGSENMFFETCGAGRAVTLGVERGWLVVAPRQSLLGLALDVEQMLDALGESFPIDRRRVMLVGHSMGAQQVTRQAARRPELIAAAVALGGGGTAPSGEAARKIPWFVAAGQFDFGNTPARSLARRLKENGAPVEFREYEHVEHMVVVQASLDDVFRFLDSRGSLRGPTP